MEHRNENAAGDNSGASKVLFGIRDNDEDNSEKTERQVPYFWHGDYLKNRGFWCKRCEDFFAEKHFFKDCYNRDDWIGDHLAKFRDDRNSWRQQAGDSEFLLGWECVYYRSHDTLNIFNYVKITRLPLPFLGGENE